MDARIFLALFAFSLLWFLRSVGYEFVDFDDTRVLVGHPNLYNESSLFSSLREIFVGYFPREEPLLLRDLSWAIDARLYGFGNPFGYHFGNVVLNAFNVGLLYLLLRRTTRSVETGAFVAICFAILPVHVEAVCWVMGRKDMLAAFFMLAGLLAQSFELEDRPLKQRRALYLLALCCSVLALFSKASALVFFVVLALHRVLHPYLEGGCGPGERLDWIPRIRRAAFAVMPHAALSALFFIWYQGVVGEYGVIQADAPG
ncbi:MAG: phospholipid carrier-dependent glycosyltransferase, partial [Myxococcales bacterium]|nr:phospholipid carrier-dependent glycosyltransferase [Myxococcales bacterium]